MSDQQNELVSEEITQVNSRRKSGNVVTAAGFAALALVAGCIAYLSSSDDSTPKKEVEKSEIRNTMPSVNYTEADKAIEPSPEPHPESAVPPVPPAMIAQNQPLPPTNNLNTKPVISPWERKRNGGIIVASSDSSSTSSTSSNSKIESPATPYSVQPAAPPPPEEKGLSGSLKATQIASVSAGILPNRNFLLTKGSTLDCILKTALDSSLSGLATCQITRDIYSTNGKVVLLDKGSLVTGEYQGGMKMGQNRLFLLWNRVETPTGVIIDINSPSIDPVGRTGIDGWVDNHFADRFAAAILVSLLQDATQAGQAYLQGIASNGGTNTTTNITSVPQAATEIVKSILQQQAAIPPTLNKNQGDHIQIMIARDLDFSSLYSLKPAN
jgi:type IV secretion system protein VirB10